MARHQVKNLSKRMARSQTSSALSTAGASRGMSRADIESVVRRLGFVAVKTFETIQGNLISSGQEQLAETLNDVLKPLCDMLLHFELEMLVHELEGPEERNGE